MRYEDVTRGMDEALARAKEEHPDVFGRSEHQTFVNDQDWNGGGIGIPPLGVHLEPEARRMRKPVPAPKAVASRVPVRRSRLTGRRTLGPLRARACLRSDGPDGRRS